MPEDFGGEGEEDGDDLGVELAAGIFAKDGSGALGRHGAAIGAVSSHCIPRVDHVNDAGFDGRLGTGLAEGVAGAVPIFVMELDGGEVGRKSVNALENAAADDGMLFDEVPFF